MKLRKRCIKRNNNIKRNSITIYGINAAGIKCKIDSFNEVLSTLKPQIWMIEETKLRVNEHIKCEALSDFQVFYLSRQKSQGGGIAVGINKMFQSTLISEGDDETEAISVLVVVGDIPIRVIVGYGPQENAPKEKKENFWEFIEKEVIQAETEGQGIIIQMDGNLHAGEKIIKHDPNIQNQNGKLFMDFLQRNDTLKVVNSMNICEGLITRQRLLESRSEKAVLDFFITNEKLSPYLKRMVVDEKREFSLGNFSQYKQNKRVIESDHNGLILELALEYSAQMPERQEVFNFRNTKCQEAFYKETNDNIELLKCFENELPFEKQSKMWLKTFNSIIYKCFRKIRICKNRKKSLNNKNALLRKRIKLIKEARSKETDEVMKGHIEEKIKSIEKDIGNEIVSDYHKEIVETIKDIGGDETSIDGSGRQKLWKVLKRKCPKEKSNIPTGKKDRKGNIISNHKGLKILYLKTYKHRLRNRPIQKGFEEIRDLKMMLFNIRKELCMNRKSEPWDMKNLEKALKSLKKNKARDPNGWTNDIFKEGVAGENLKMSILKLFNKIKNENFIPEFMRKADITTLYKGKGEKSNLDNERGIFIVPVFRSLIMKLIYQEIYEIIDKSMSESQIGSRRGKNIRNHVWILNSIVSDILSTKKKNPVDIQIYDYKQCFDGLWLEECLNDIYSGGLKDDKLNLVHNANSLVNIVVKTPVGKTDQTSIKDVVIQGDVFAPLLCSKQIDRFGKECLEANKYTYLYKGEVKIPPLAMVDDILAISECGFKSTMVNSFLNCKTSTKKLQFGGNKCKKMHIGKQLEDFKCHPIFVGNWKEEDSNDITGEHVVNDIFLGKVEMEDTEEEKYLGDIISKDGRNLKNIKARVNKGKSIVKRILDILDSMPFGKLYFQVAILLRNSLLVSSVLCNSETWFNLNKAELELLESVDLMLMRNLLRTTKSTQKEMFYLELGIIPLREIIKQRRLNFLHYILSQDEDSIMFNVFEKQYQERHKKD